MMEACTYDGGNTTVVILSKRNERCEKSAIGLVRPCRRLRDSRKVIGRVARGFRMMTRDKREMITNEK